MTPDLLVAEAVEEALSDLAPLIRYMEHVVGCPACNADLDCATAASLRYPP